MTTNTTKLKTENARSHDNSCKESEIQMQTTVDFGVHINIILLYSISTIGEYIRY